jgi:hypothetical protein
MIDYSISGVTKGNGRAGQPKNFEPEVCSGDVARSLGLNEGRNRDTYPNFV